MPFGMGGPNGSMGGGLQASGGFPLAAGNPAGWSMNNGGPGDASGLHNPGVIRRGGGRYSNRSGPYDRRAGRFGPGGSMGNGRVSPGRMFGAGGRMSANAAAAAAYIPPGHPAALAAAAAGMGPGAGGRWGDNAGGGVQAMGPKEAVQGRSLKSYEDLDAVGGAGSGELNY